MFDRGQRRGSRAALEAGNGDMVGAALGDACGDGSDAGLGDEFDRDTGLGIDVLQIEDELGQSSIE